MDKISKFYANAMADENIKARLETVLDGTDISQASKEQLVKIGGLAKELGYEITLEEVKEFFNPTEKELGDEDLDAVAGGKGPKVYVRYEDKQRDICVDWERVN